MKFLPDLAFAAVLAVAFIARPGFAPDDPATSTDAEAADAQDGDAALQSASPESNAPVLFVPDDSARLPGIDVSHYQGEIDWTRVAASGVAFAYSKATQGVTGVDSKVTSNIAAASAAGLPVGAYHFYEPADDPVEQARHFLATVRIGPASLPPALDIEKAPSAADKASFSGDILTWMQYVETQTGCTPLLYASPSFFKDNFDETLNGTPYWLAEYSTTPKPPSGDSTWVLWQHSQSGTVDGITGAVDLDWFAGTADTLGALACGAGTGDDG